MNKKVTVVIPCYNDADFIERSIKSAINQTYASKEIIVIDDGSNAATKKVLQKLRPQIDLLITQENQGVVSARNNGIMKASGEYILTLDSDDYYESSFLEKAVEILNEDAEVGMVTCWMNRIDAKGKKINTIKPSGAPASKALFFNNAPGTLLFRKLCWKQASGYDRNLKNGNEDWEFNISVTKKGWVIKVIPEILYFYQEKKSSRNITAKNYRKEIRKYTFSKHQDLLIENIEESIGFFLNEIEMRENENYKLKNSFSYQLGELILKPVRFVKSFFD